MLSPLLSHLAELLKWGQSGVSMGRKNAGGAPSLLEPQCWTWTSQGVEATGNESWPDELGKVQCVKVLDVLGGEVTY